MMWKASVMVKFEAVYRNFPGQIEQYRESVIWTRGFLNRYSNLESSDRMSDITHFSIGAITYGAAVDVVENKECYQLKLEVTTSV